MADEKTAPQGRRVEEDLSPTLSASGKRRWLYPDRRSGAYAKRRKYLAAFLILFYLIAPWATLGGNPFLRVDVLAQKVFLFGQVFAFSDGRYLIFLLLIAALGLFFVTTLWGRVWCGYACPQTVFVEWVIRPIEEWVEGNAHKRRHADSLPMTWNLRLRKAFKHFLFLIVAALAANAFLAYFFPPTVLLSWMVGSPAEHPGPFFFMLFLMLAFYFDLGWFREQFCTFVCPYARFQSVLMDEHTPAVAYDVTRGEPRGRKAGSGDCIDCELCVRVCPTGIDIRKGWQLECIMCNRCIDACDLVMTNLKRPPKLIKKMSMQETAGGKPRALRARSLLYGALLVLVTSVFAYNLLTRPDMDWTLTRAPGTTFMPVDADHVGNLFQARVVNLTGRAIPLHIDASEASGVVVDCGSCADVLKPYEERKFPILVRFKRGEHIDGVVLRHGASGESKKVSLLQP